MGRAALQCTATRHAGGGYRSPRPVRHGPCRRRLMRAGIAGEAKGAARAGRRALPFSWSGRPRHDRTARAAHSLRMAITPTSRGQPLAVGGWDQAWPTFWRCRPAGTGRNLRRIGRSGASAALRMSRASPDGRSRSRCGAPAAGRGSRATSPCAGPRSRLNYAFVPDISIGTNQNIDFCPSRAAIGSVGSARQVARCWALPNCCTRRCRTAGVKP